MRLALLALLLAVALTGCSTTRRVVGHFVGYPFVCSGVYVCGSLSGSVEEQAALWEDAAVASTLLDIEVTRHALRHGAREANPIYGDDPGRGRMVATNAALYATVKLALRGAPAKTKRAVWITWTAARLAAVAYGLSRR